MADVLSQSEVEALLAALDQGGGGSAAETSAPAEQQGEPAAPLPADITLYDFKRPERVSKEHMRSLQSLHEGFSRNLGASLSGFLRTIVDVKLVSVDQLTYSEFVFSLENPTCYNVLTCAPLEGYMVLEINSSIVYPILGRLLGGGNDVHIPSRPLTEIETRLINKITNMALEGLRAVWSNVMPVDFLVDRIESNPQLVYIVPPNEVVVLVSFEIAIGDIRGMMNLCVPFNVIEPVMDQLAANTWISYVRKEQSKRREVVDALGVAPVDLVVFLGETTITAQDLMNLQVGDLLPLDKPVDSGLLVCVGARPKFRGAPGQLHGRKVIRITRRCDKKARING